MEEFDVETVDMPTAFMQAATGKIKHVKYHQRND
jgi:hypothetical protein